MAPPTFSTDPFPVRACGELSESGRKQPGEWGPRACNELWRSSVYPSIPPPPTLLGLPGPPGRATGRRVRRVRCGSARASSQGFLLGCSWALPAFGKSPKPRSRGEPTIAEAHAASCPHTATCNALCPGFWFPAVSRCLLFLLSKIMSSPGNLRSSRPLGACCLAGAFLLSSPGRALPPAACASWFRLLFSPPGLWVCSVLRCN